MEWKRGKWSEGICGNEDERHPLYGKILGSRKATHNNGIKTTMKSKSCKKTKSLVGNEDTTDRGIRHGQTVVSSGSTFFYSFFVPRV